MKEASLTLPLLASGFRPWLLFLEVKSRFSMGSKVLVLEVRGRPRDLKDAVFFNRATEGARRLRSEYRTMNQWLEVKRDSYTVYGCILSLAPVEHVATEGREGAQLYEV
jgi:hypothetical protein